MGEFSIFHWLIVLAIVLIFFGGRRIPEVMKGLGEGIRSLRTALAAHQRPHSRHRKRSRRPRSPQKRRSKRQQQRFERVAKAPAKVGAFCFAEITRRICLRASPSPLVRSGPERAGGRLR